MSEKIKVNRSSSLGYEYMEDSGWTDVMLVTYNVTAKWP